MESSTHDAIIVADSENRIVDVNPAFTHITQYSREEAIGKDPGFTKSGRHTAEFYKTMWNSIETTGRWQGDIWDRRKDGSTFPKWLTIDTLNDEDGRVSHRIGVFSDISELKAVQDELSYLAYYDALTKLPNRVLFKDRLSLKCKEAQRSGKKIAIFFIDLDHFKKVNDSLGHRYGDQVLEAAAQRITQCVRNQDTVARFGGDEFTVVLDDVRDAAAVAEVAKKIIKAIGQPIKLAKHEVIIGASIGVAIAPKDGRDYDTLTRHADGAIRI